MKKRNSELEFMDRIILFIANKEGLYINESELLKENFANNKRLDFLVNEGIINKTSIPVAYILTQKGIIFNMKGGFKGEQQKNDFVRNSNLFNTIITPITAIFSTIISIIAIWLSIHNNQNDINFNLSVPSIQKMYEISGNLKHVAKETKSLLNAQKIE